MEDEKEIEGSSSEEEEKKKKKEQKKKGKKKNGESKKSKKVESVLGPEEFGRMIDLGLGRGVNATSPSPWLNKTSFQVREVTPYNILGTDEGGVLQSYSHEMASVQCLQTKMSASIPFSQQVSVGVDAELSRNYSTSRRSVGKKIITRTISYKADFDDLIRRSSTGEFPAVLDNKPAALRRQSSLQADRKLSAIGRRISTTSSSEEGFALTFEQRLSKWILERLLEDEVDGVDELEIHSYPNQVLANFIAEWRGKDVQKLVAQKCKEFVGHFNITHYVSSIELGASKHRVMSEEEYQTHVGVKGSLGVDQIASVAVKQSASFGRRIKFSQLIKIGHFEGDVVALGTTDEAVVSVKFQPISTLVKMKLLRKKLEHAITSYIDNQENSKAGPFIISCGNEKIFLKVTTDFRVVGTTNIKESSDFYISSNEDGDTAYEFSIMYMAPSPLVNHGIKPIARYLYAPVNTFGNNRGPLTLRLDAKDTKTKMTLHSRRVRHFSAVDTADWVSSTDIFYINCKQRAVKKNGYICVRRSSQDSGVDEEYVTCCVPSISKHSEAKDQYMLFRLLRARKRNKEVKTGDAGEDEVPTRERQLSNREEEEGEGVVGVSLYTQDQLGGEDAVDSVTSKKKENKGQKQKKKGGKLSGITEEDKDTEEGVGEGKGEGEVGVMGEN